MALKKAIKIVKNLTKNQLLEGLGGLLEDEKQKAWVKDKLVDELLFQLKLAQLNRSENKKIKL